MSDPRRRPDGFYWVRWAGMVGLPMTVGRYTELNSAGDRTFWPWEVMATDDIFEEGEVLVVGPVHPPGALHVWMPDAPPVELYGPFPDAGRAQEQGSTMVGPGRVVTVHALTATTEEYEADMRAKRV